MPPIFQILSSNLDLVEDLSDLKLVKQYLMEKFEGKLVGVPRNFWF
jgi:hypothetical protein